MRMNLKDRFISLENEDNTPNPEEVGEVEVGEDSLEADLGEIAEVSADVEQADEQQEVMEDVAESLEAIAQHINASLEHGGMTPREAAAIDLATNIALNRVGLANESVGMESFAGASGRQSATVSMENAVKEWAVRIWEAIKRGIARVREFVKSLYIKIFDAAPKLKRRADALIIKAKDLKAPKDGPKEVSMTDGEATGLAIGDKVPSALKDLTSVLEGVSSDITGTFRSSAVTFVESVDAALRTVKVGGPVTIGEAVQAALEKIKAPTLARTSDVGSDKRFEGKQVDKSAVLPGNMALFLIGTTKKKVTVGDLNGLAGLELKVLPAEADGPKKVSGGKLDAASPADIAAAATAIAKIANEIADYRKKFAQTEALTKKLDSTASAYVKAVDGNEKVTGEDKATAKSLLEVVASASNIVDKGVSEGLKYVITISGRVLQLAERHEKAYAGAK